MKQIHQVISLTELAGDEPFLAGIPKGREVFQKLERAVRSHPSTSVFCISLKGVRATDASFPREGVISLIKMFSGEKGFFLKDFARPDLLENWDYAAKAKEQNVIVLEKDGTPTVIGPKISEPIKATLDFVMQEGIVTASRVAKQFSLSPQAASGRMKKLTEMSLVLASKESAESGGPEFVYRAIM